MSDLIKREDAINAVIEWYGCKPNDIEAFEKIIEAIPSADRPRGRVMTFTEKELNQFLHGISLSLLSKKSAQHWRYDEETAKEIEWLEVLERKVRADKADRKTENSSEKPNSSTISKMEQVDKDMNVPNKRQTERSSE